MGVRAPGTSGNKTEAAAGGPLWGRRPRNEAGPRGPALPSAPAAALTRSRIRPVAPAPEPAENSSGAGSTCSVSPGTPGFRTTTPSRLRETNAQRNEGSRGTKDPLRPQSVLFYSVTLSVRSNTSKMQGTELLIRVDTD
ncbi:uncharacterized protein V5649_001436 [Rhynchonycteris naso]